jgi:hypothetical protein
MTKQQPAIEERLAPLREEYRRADEARRAQILAEVEEIKRKYRQALESVLCTRLSAALRGGAR